MTRHDRWLRRIVLTVILVAGATASIATSETGPRRIGTEWNREPVGQVGPAWTPEAAASRGEIERRVQFCFPDPPPPRVIMVASLRPAGALEQGLGVPAEFSVGPTKATAKVASRGSEVAFVVTDVPVSPETRCTEWGSLVFRQSDLDQSGGLGAAVEWRFEVEDLASSGSASPWWHVQVRVDDAPVEPAFRDRR